MSPTPPRPRINIGKCSSFPLSVGANLHACVQYDEAPPSDSDYYVDFQAGASTDTCMNARGNNARAAITDAGLTCADLGYVELDAGVFNGCWSSASWWESSFNVPATGQSGSINSRWYTKFDNPYVYLSGNPTANLCKLKELCKKTGQEFTGIGELWVSSDHLFGIASNEDTDGGSPFSLKTAYLLPSHFQLRHY